MNVRLPIGAIVLGLVMLFGGLVGGCGLLPEVKDETGNWSVERIFQTGREAVQEGNYLRAIKLFESLESRYPYGPYAQQSILQQAYANYKLGEMAAAPVLPRLFTSDPRVGSVATQSLWWVAGMLPLSGLAFAVDGVAVAAARTRLLMVIMVVCFAAFSVAMVAADRWWGPLQLGFITALLGAFMALRAVLGVQRIRAADWSGDWADTSSTQDAEPLVLG